jgi:hypothetical protein
MPTVTANNYETHYEISAIPVMLGRERAAKTSDYPIG